MSEIIGFRTIQKCRYFLAGVFPFLATKGRGDALARWLQRYPRVVALGARLATSASPPVGRSVARRPFVRLELLPRRYGSGKPFGGRPQPGVFHLLLHGAAKAAAPLLRWAEMRWTAASLVCLTAFAGYRAVTDRMVPHTIPGSAMVAPLPAGWTLQACAQVRRRIQRAVGTWRARFRPCHGRGWSLPGGPHVVW